MRIKSFTYIFVGLLSLLYGCPVMSADNVEIRETPTVGHAHDIHLQKLMYAINDMDTEEVKRVLQALSDDEKHGLLGRKIPVQQVVGIGKGSTMLKLNRTPREQIDVARVCGIIFWNLKLEKIEKLLQRADSAYHS